MRERITLVSLFKDEDVEKIYRFFEKIDEPLCKVPFGKGVVDRKTADTLPFYFTLSAWNLDMEDYLIPKLENVKFEKFCVKVVE